MSYQQIKKVSRGRKWMIVILVCCSLVFVFFRKMAMAQKIIELTGNASNTENNWTCAIQYLYTNQFDNFVTRDNQKVTLNDTNNTVNKCEPVSIELKKTGLWDGRMIYSPPPPPPPPPYTPDVWTANPGACGACGGACACGGSACGTPPADFLECNSLDDCLNQGTEGVFALDSPGTGKGIFQEPTTLTLRELSGSPYMNCSNNVCTSNTSGNFNFEEKNSATKFFGQCRDAASGTTVKVSSDVAEAANQFGVTVANRAPVPTVSFAKNPINPNEEVDVTCDIVDPDECVDKIAKVKWICADSNGNSGNCFIWKEDTGIFTPGGAVQNLVPSEQSNPYRATAKFKATQIGNYAVTCEATDNDANNPLTGTGINNVTVVENCEADSICNVNCPADPDCTYGQIPAHSGYCALMPGEGEASDNTICGTSGNATYEAYTSGIEAKAYRWQCYEGGPVVQTDEPKVTCPYDKSGTYKPTLKLVRADGAEKDCDLKAETTLTDKSECTLTADKTSINVPGKVEASITKQCLSGGKTNWEATNGRITSSDNNSATIEFNSAGTGQIKASVTTSDGKTVNCGGVGAASGSGGSDGLNIEIKEKVRFGM